MRRSAGRANLRRLRSAMQNEAEAACVAPPFFVAIGASGANGLGDIRLMLTALPADLPAVILVVLHRPSDQISHLHDVLSRSSTMPVVLAIEDDEFRIGCC